MNLTFLGGAGTVTGSKHLLTVGDRRILIDCGLFQGVKEQRLLNWKPLPVSPRTLSAVILTHAHLDHTGYLPLLVKQGFSGPIYCSRPTAELTELILLDAAHLNQEDAADANHGGYSKHHPALPLYDVKDAQAVFKHLKTLKPEEWHPIEKEIEIRLSPSGHILGSTFVEVRAQDKVVVFSGDLGRPAPLTLHPPAQIREADFLILESTYGHRCHSAEPPAAALRNLVNRTHERSGVVVIPSFAVGRTQDILHLLAILKSEGQIPDLPVYLDSPMAAEATSVFDRFPNWHRLSSPDLRRLSRTFRQVTSVKHSISICQSREPCIVLAGSGMLNGGRIRHHLASRLTHPENTVILTGFQAAGTPGRFLREGASELKLFGKYFPVRAEIAEISSLSAHADQHEILEWLAGFTSLPGELFLVHGEAHAAEGLRVRIRDRFGVTPHVAKLGEQRELGSGRSLNR